MTLMSLTGWGRGMLPSHVYATIGGAAYWVARSFRSLCLSQVRTPISLLQDLHMTNQYGVYVREHLSGDAPYQVS